MAEKQKVKFTARVANYFRSLKSEIKKIVWSPWKQVKKNTAVVLAVVVAFAILIGVLDYGFAQSIVLLKNIFS